MPSPSGSAVKLRLQRAEPGAQRAGGAGARPPGLGGVRTAGVDGVEAVRAYLWSLQYTIAAGTSQIQRNLIAERILGMPRSPMTADRPSVLGGIRVLDYGRFIAAPWCSAILADMGADVIRVEKREGGEDRWVQSVTDGGEGGTFLQCNRNKRSLTLDSTTPEGAEITRRLVAGADIVDRQHAGQGHAGQRARLREPAGGQARHHPRQRHGVRRGRARTATRSASTAPARSCPARSTARACPTSRSARWCPYADFGTALTLAHRRDDGAVPPAGHGRGPARRGAPCCPPR